MLVLTTDTLPPDLELIETFGLITTTYPIQVSQKGLMQRLVERDRNEQQEAFDAFVKSAPREANVVYGVKLSTAAAVFKDGSFLFMTYYGTAGRYEIVERRS